MKRRDLLKFLLAEGCVLVWHGAGHDLYRNQITLKQDAVPRHNEIKEMTVRAIIRNLSTPDSDSNND